MVYFAPGSVTPVWIWQNMLLEQFNDSVTLYLAFDLDPNLLLAAGAVVDSVDLAFEKADSIWVAGQYIPVTRRKVWVEQKEIDRDGIQWDPIFEDDVLTNPQPPLTPTWTVGDNKCPGRIGCNMPNGDLNNTLYGPTSPNVPSDYPGDKNACAPAATANSFPG